MKLKWDESGKRFYENGVSNGVLYPQNKDGSYSAGVAWNGLTSINNSPDGAEPNELWADNMKYGILRSAETLALTIEAYMYPVEFEECDGMVAPSGTVGVTFGQQKRKSFGLVYRTEVGNDVDTDVGYKLHIVYGCTAQPSDKDFETINDSPDAITFSWEVDTLPVPVKGMEPVSEIVVDSCKFTTTAEKAALTALENKLFGTDTEGDTAGTDPTLPSPSEVIATLTVSGNPSNH